MAKDKPAELPGTDLLFGSHAKGKGEPAEAIEVKSAARGETLPIKIVPVEDSEPVKFTFYFSPQLLEELEVAKFRLRMEKRLKVSKSDIVNAALRHALKDMSFLERLIEGKIND